MKLAAIVLLFATEMVRVLEVPDGRTLVVERRSGKVAIQLAGVELTDPRAARELLAWNAARGSWVMLEPQGNGYRVYRSPDALFLNRELVLRGFARAVEDGIEPAPLVPMKYLGVVNPGLPTRAPSRAGEVEKPKKKREKVRKLPPPPRPSRRRGSR
jgi:hypothetical protein